MKNNFEHPQNQSNIEGGERRPESHRPEDLSSNDPVLERIKEKERGEIKVLTGEKFEADLGNLEEEGKRISEDIEKYGEIRWMTDWITDAIAAKAIKNEKIRARFLKERGHRTSDATDGAIDFSLNLAMSDRVMDAENKKEHWFFSKEELGSFQEMPMEEKLEFLESSISDRQIDRIETFITHANEFAKKYGLAASFLKENLGTADFVLDKIEEAKRARLFALQSGYDEDNEELKRKAQRELHEEGR